jgi:hypothetical protein
MEPVASKGRLRKGTRFWEVGAAVAGVADVPVNAKREAARTARKARAGRLLREMMDETKRM